VIGRTDRFRSAEKGRGGNWRKEQYRPSLDATKMRTNSPDETGEIGEDGEDVLEMTNLHCGWWYLEVVVGEEL
jgi:hypothetical protein